MAQPPQNRKERARVFLHSMACGKVPPAITKRDRAVCQETITIATFYNQATLSYSGGRVNSNTVTGELQENVTVTKTAVSADYAPGGDIAYVIGIVNAGVSDLTGVTVTDDLGGYDFNGTAVYPLAYTAGSLLYYVDGVLQAAPAVEAGPPLVISGIEIPAGSNALLIYEAAVTEYAPLGGGAQIENTVTVNGSCIADPILASAVIPAELAPALTISKSVSPDVVSGCGELTYTFVIQNTGSAEASAEDAVTVEDTFDPVLKAPVVTLDGAELTLGGDYEYDETTGFFRTVPGRVTVPAATFAQNSDGSWTATPGVTVLTVSGTL